MVKNDCGRRSSGGGAGVVNRDIVCAADLMARNEAVKLDRNVDPRPGNERGGGDGVGDFATVGSENVVS